MFVSRKKKMSQKQKLFQVHKDLAQLMVNSKNSSTGICWTKYVDAHLHNPHKGYNFSIGSTKFRDGYVASPWFERFCEITAFITGAKNSQLRDSPPKTKDKSNDKKDRMVEGKAVLNVSQEDTPKQITSDPAYFFIRLGPTVYLSLEDAKNGTTWQYKDHEIKVEFVNSPQAVGGRIQVPEDVFPAFMEDLKALVDPDALEYPF